jgi:hypothetical protein
MQMKIVRKIRPVRLIPGGGGVSTGVFLAAILGNPPRQIALSAKRHGEKIAIGITEGKASWALTHRNLKNDPTHKPCVARQHRFGMIFVKVERKGIAVKRATILASLLLGPGFCGSAAAAETRPAAKAQAQSCLVQVLSSEEIPLGPMFHHTVKATLLVTPPDRPPFQTTVEKVTPWQVPPPRQGQRAWVTCDQASLNSFAFY